jgi:uncharacterized protein with PQ loop repeat
MYSASFLYLLCYIPAFYAEIKNKNANVYNLPERVFSLTGTSLALSYALTIDNMPLIVNYASHLILEMCVFLVKINYVYLNGNKKQPIEDTSKETFSPIHNV